MIVRPGIASGEPLVFDPNDTLQSVQDLHERYSERLIINPDLTRSLVSFQGNKSAPFLRWFKYKEGFSGAFVDYVLDTLSPTPKTRRLLDPFAGVGTAPMIAARRGWNGIGIELLPVGVMVAKTRLAAEKVKPSLFHSVIDEIRSLSFNDKAPKYRFSHLRITQAAFSDKTELELSNFMDFIEKLQNDDVRLLLKFACMAILEKVSFTRKDGQYLRWDHRAARRLKSRFNKGEIPDFKSALLHQLETMLYDMNLIERSLTNEFRRTGNVEMIEGTCLAELPLLQDTSVDLIITSPPYVNRYDYTRTYALELAFLECSEEKVKRLRQDLLSCTVENKSKRNQLSNQYSRSKSTDLLNRAFRSFSEQEALQDILVYLKMAATNGQLNNPNIPNLIENYFMEMSVVIHELARILTPGGRVIMVNDNVQYHGIQVPVDLILSDIAQNAGLCVDQIWVLPRGKGNSSQQMGVYGRNELRKCVYIWSRPG